MVTLAPAFASPANSARQPAATLNVCAHLSGEAANIERVRVHVNGRFANVVRRVSPSAVVDLYADRGARRRELAFLVAGPSREGVSDQLERPALEPLHRQRRPSEDRPYQLLTVPALFPVAEKTLVGVAAHSPVIDIPATRV